MTRAGLALRQKWAQEAERARRARDPRLAAQDRAERAVMNAGHRARARYTRLVRAAIDRGEITVERAFELVFAADDRLAQRLEVRRARIFGGDR